MREIHFFESEKAQRDWLDIMRANDIPVTVANDYVGMDDIQSNIPEGDVAIATTQMCFLSTRWIEDGFKIIVHDRTGDFEIVIGEGNERTDRHIRWGHDLFRLWRNGEFEPPNKKEESE